MVLFVLVWCPVNFVDVDFFIADPSNILPFCNLIGSARIPAETKGQPKKVNVSNQTPFSEGGAVGVVWGRDYQFTRFETEAVPLPW